MPLILIIILLVLVLAGLPTWPYAAQWGWGYYPSGLFAVVLIVLLILLALGRV
jgi:hypothetical protein